MGSDVSEPMTLHWHAVIFIGVCSAIIACIILWILSQVSLNFHQPEETACRVPSATFATMYRVCMIFYYRTTFFFSRHFAVVCMGIYTLYFGFRTRSNKFVSVVSDLSELPAFIRATGVTAARVQLFINMMRADTDAMYRRLL